MLIRNAELETGVVTNVRIRGGRVAAIGNIEPDTDEEIIEAAERLLLPGLHDHHIHLAATAAALSSIGGS